MLKLPSQTFPRNDGKHAMPKPAKGSAQAARAAKKPPKVKPERGVVGARLRAMVMERDGFTCQRCGGSPVGFGDKHAERLVVDHVLPVAQGGLTVEENLQTLCAACNAGKGARRDFEAEKRARRARLPQTDKIVEQLKLVVGKKRKRTT